MGRNPDLDIKLPIDKKIGDLQIEEETGRSFRMINGNKIYQIEEKFESDADLNLIINRYRASGMKMSDYLKSQI